MQNKRRTPMAVLFLIIMSLPLCVHLILNRDIIPDTENRVKAAFPSLPVTVAQLQGLPLAADAYVSDNFGLRNSLRLLHSLTKWALQMQFMPTVVRGRGDWLFAGDQIDKSMSQYLGLFELSDNDIAEWARDVSAIKKGLNERGIAFFLLVPPDKYRFYSRYLPRTWNSEVPPSPLTRITDFLKANEIDVGLVYPAESLLNAEKEHPVFCTMDSHWNSPGAFAAYTDLIEEISREISGLASQSDNPRKIVITKSSRSDLLELISLNGIIDEIRPEMDVTYESSPIENVNCDKEYSRMPYWRYSRNSASAEKRCLIYYDSSLMMISRPLEYTFKETIWIMRYIYPFNDEIISRTKPDVVLVSINERMLPIHISKHTPLFGHDAVDFSIANYNEMLEKIDQLLLR